MEADGSRAPAERPVPRRVGAVGTFVWDRICPAGAAEPPLEQWGGMAYSLASLSAHSAPRWVVEPLVKVGQDLAGDALRFMADLPCVEPGAGLLPVPHPNNRVELRYRDAAERDEILTGGVPPWNAEELLPHLPGLDALYVNFLSGQELDLATARAVRAAFAGPIYADLHSLFLGPPGAGPRPPRPLADWDRWLGCFDVVQLNERELRLLAGGAFVRDLRGVLDHGPALVVVTLGADGVRFASRGGRVGGWLELGAPDRGEISAARRLAGDPTGCGDVWGSAFFASLLNGSRVRAAAAAANAAAARKILTSRIAALRDALAAERREQRAG